MSTADAGAIHAYWFGDTSDWVEVAKRNNARWFRNGSDLDGEIRERFGDAVAQARAGALAHWLQKPETLLALVLLLDQFPRHIFRGTANAFASDEQALAACRQGIDRGLDRCMSHVERGFFYLPLQHAEDLVAQRLSVELLGQCACEAPESLVDVMSETLRYGEVHRDIVERFGRFPHRNQILGRKSTAQEQAYLDGGGQRFGQ